MLFEIVTNRLVLLSSLKVYVWEIHVFHRTANMFLFNMHGQFVAVGWI